GTDTGQIRLNRSGNTSQPLTVTIALGGSAAIKADYDLVPGLVNQPFPAGAGAIDIMIVPKDDPIDEPSQTATVTIVSGSGYIVGSAPTATVTIADNDPAT